MNEKRAAHFKNLTGQQFGRLRVLALESVVNYVVRWVCLCECGKQTVVTGNNLKSGCTKSCGCLHVELANTYGRKHGKYGTKIYRAWGNIKKRCCNPKNKAWKNYGGRGIKICGRWLNSFENFFADIGDVPPGMTIDRIDNNDDYRPGNVRFANVTTQNNNKRSNRWVTFNGRTQTAESWSRELGFYANAVYQRLSRGWTVERALTEAPRCYTKVRIK